MAEPARWAEWFETIAELELGPTQSEFTREIGGLFGIGGEQILVAIETEVEKTLCKTVAAEADGVAKAWSRRSLRFFAEGQANSIVIFGHTVANMTIRTLALGKQFPATPILKKAGLKEDVFVPFSKDRRAWASLNEPTVNGICAEAATTGIGEVVEFADACASLWKDPAINNLFELRGEQYHRWRTESPGVTGLSLTIPSIISRLMAGQVVGFGGPPAPFPDGDKVVDEVVTASTKALECLGAHLGALLDGWRSAFEAIRPA